MAKRASLKGKGADIFLGTEKEERKVRAKGRSRLNKKATFYFPPSLLDGLDNVWIELRKDRKNLKKSDLVSTALGAALKEYKEKQEESELYKILFP